MGLFAFKIRVTWLLVEFIRNIVTFYQEWLPFYAANFLLPLQEEWRYYEDEQIYTDILSDQVIYIADFERSYFFIKYFGNLVCLLTWGGSVSCLMWYGIHIEKGVWKIICYTSKDTVHHLIFNMVYLGTNWIWKRIIIFQSLLHTISRLPGFLDK